MSSDKQYINSSGGYASLAWCLCCFFLLVASGCSSPNTLGRATSSARVVPTQEMTTSITHEQPSSTTSVIDADGFVDTKIITDALLRSRAQSSVLPCSYDRAGVVNHHTLASDLLADFFVKLARCRPDLQTVIILSPDHFQAGQAPFVTHLTSYRTSGEDVLVQSSSVQRLLKIAPFGRVDVHPFLREHGVGALVPFLHQVLPHASVVPVDIEGRITAEDSRAIERWLQEELKDPHTFVLVSSDMSHYLSEVRAQRNDQETMRAFQQQDSHFFFRVSDGYTDNGKSIAIVLNALHPKKWELQSHKSSSEYGGSVLNTTTYINGFWSTLMR